MIIHTAIAPFRCQDGPPLVSPLGCLAPLGKAGASLRTAGQRHCEAVPTRHKDFVHLHCAIRTPLQLGAQEPGPGPRHNRIPN